MRTPFIMAAIAIRCGHAYNADATTNRHYLIHFLPPSCVSGFVSFGDINKESAIGIIILETHNQQLL